MIEARDISYQMGERYLVRSLSASFRVGEMTVIMGSNGAGKSTLLKLLTGALTASSGQILYKEKELNLTAKQSRPSSGQPARVLKQTQP